VGVQWDEWEQIYLQLDVERALEQLDPDERRFVELLLEGKSLSSALRECRWQRRDWERLRAKLEQLLR
jgi:hypothetical protein